eukprot:1372377-Amphidinium_carterae.1
MATNLSMPTIGTTFSPLSTLRDAARTGRTKRRHRASSRVQDGSTNIMATRVRIPRQSDALTNNTREWLTPLKVM